MWHLLLGKNYIVDKQDDDIAHLGEEVDRSGVVQSRGQHDEQVIQ